MPAGFSPDVAGIEAFARLLIEAAGPFAAAVKPNLAFFEAFGPAGIAALERIRASLPADLPVVADAKRGDIGSTAARQAVALFDRLGADAVTANPYLGSEAIAPLLERTDRFAYVLCRTSNPGAGELQDLVVAASPDGSMPRPSRSTRGSPGRPADGVRAGPWGSSWERPRPTSWPRIRAVAPGLAFLVPGVGAQGGDVEPVLATDPPATAPAGAGPGGGLLVNVSRGIAQAALAAAGAGSADDPGERIAAAARQWAARLPVLL